MLAPAIMWSSMLATVATAAGPGSDDHRWRSYTNDRYGQAICYPADLVRPDPPPGNDDGRSFTAADGAQIKTWASYNALDSTLAASAQADADQVRGEGGTVTYRTMGDSFYVVSGRQGNRIFYRRTFLLNGLFSTVEITYPSADRVTWDAVTARVSGCFRPARGR